uniref:Uncharacterized protein n=1 Tax=Schistocephalus solidus TaxID=70667 RepID=A0A0X3NTV4_SCHSO
MHILCNFIKILSKWCINVRQLTAHDTVGGQPTIFHVSNPFFGLKVAIEAKDRPLLRISIHSEDEESRRRSPAPVERTGRLFLVLNLYPLLNFSQKPTFIGKIMSLDGIFLRAIVTSEHFMTLC